MGARARKLSTNNLRIPIFVLAPGRPRLAIFIFFVSKTAAIQKSAVLKTDFFEDARPEIHRKRRATDTSATWGVEKRLKFKKAPFSTHPTFFGFSRRVTVRHLRDFVPWERTSGVPCETAGSRNGMAPAPAFPFGDSGAGAIRSSSLSRRPARGGLPNGGGPTPPFLGNSGPKTMLAQGLARFPPSSPANGVYSQYDPFLFSIRPLSHLTLLGT